MKEYEAMFILKKDLNEEQTKETCSQIEAVVTKAGGKLAFAQVWATARKLTFEIRKYKEGTYYLCRFLLPEDAVAKVRHAYSLNESILRVLILTTDQLPVIKTQV